MKKLTIFVLLLLTVQANAQWEKLSLPSLLSNEKASPQIKGIKDSIVFVSSEGIGLYRSTDYGNSWESAKTLFNLNGGVNTIFSFDSLLIAFGYDNSNNTLIGRSIDDGATWTQINNPDLIYCNKIVQTQNGVNKNYIALNFDLKYGYISDDNGETWNKFETKIDSLFPVSISISNIISVGKFIYASVTYFTSNEVTSEFCVSDDNGLTWHSRNNGLPIHSSDLWLGEINTVNNTLIAKSYLGAFITTDFGNQWNKVALPNFQETYRVETIKSDGEYVYLSVSANYMSKIYKSIDSGKNWLEISEFPYYTMNNKIYCGQYNGQTVPISTDKGLTWQKNEVVFFKTIKNSISCITTNGENIFLRAGNLKYKTNSNLINWQSFDIDKYNVASLLTPGTHKFKFGAYSYATTDNGFTWNNIYVPYTISIGVHAVPPIIVYDFDEYLSQLIYVRSDGITNSQYQKLHNIPSSSIATGEKFVFVSAQNGIYRSTDSCKTIERVLPLDYYIKLAACNNTVVGCYLPNGAIWISFDNGNSWVQKFLGITDIVSIAIDDKFLFFVTKDELYKAPLENLLTDVKGENIPTSFSLSQNYPNPFNPETTIEYSIPKSEHVTLKVYDVLGREVATLVNEFKQAGNYNSKFNTLNSALSSGVYFYRLTAGSFSRTKKFILMK